jgi:hypothetical protein
MGTVGLQKDSDDEKKDVDVLAISPAVFGFHGFKCAEAAFGWAETGYSRGTGKQKDAERSGYR